MDSDHHMSIGCTNHAKTSSQPILYFEAAVYNEFFGLNLMAGGRLKYAESFPV
jgi:hypothetical protein